jgi:gas vesicle structural protein
VAHDAGEADRPHLSDGAPLDARDEERLVLGDLVNLVLDKGVMISGHVTISVADIDLVALDLRVLITSIQTALERATASEESRAEPGAGP